MSVKDAEPTLRIASERIVTEQRGSSVSPRSAKARRRRWLRRQNFQDRLGNHQAASGADGFADGIGVERIEITDRLLGEFGTDWLSGDRGNDTLSGGGGADLFIFSAANGQDLITDFNAADGDHIGLVAGQGYRISTNSAGETVIVFATDQLVACPECAAMVSTPQPACRVNGTQQSTLDAHRGSLCASSAYPRAAFRSPEDRPDRGHHGGRGSSPCDQRGTAGHRDF